MGPRPVGHDAEAEVAKTGTSRRGWAVLVCALSSTAFVARLAPLLRGGGLYGLGNYDDGVHFASALGFVHGRMPYRDFLLLHPPGVVLALAPFAALGPILGDPDRLRHRPARVDGARRREHGARRPNSPARWGGGPRCSAALAYALFYPAVYSDHTTELETVGTVLTLAALATLSGPLRQRSWWLVSLAGALLGAAAGVKIWGALFVVVVALFVGISGGLRRGLQVVLGAAVGTTAVLPALLSPGPSDDVADGPSRISSAGRPAPRDSGPDSSPSSVRARTPRTPSIRS